MFYSTFELTCKWFKKWIGPGSSIFRYKKAKFFETDYVTNWWLFERLKLKLSVQQSQLHTRSTVWKSQEVHLWAYPLIEYIYE